MTELLPVPLKKGSEVELSKPLKNLISSTYSTADKPGRLCVIEHVCLIMLHYS